MAFEHYIRSGSRFLRCGYTTGTCAALAAGGAAALLLFGHAPKTASVVTPKGVAVEAELLSCSLQNGAAVCAVRKDTVNFLRHHPLFPKGMGFYGGMMDPDTGEFNESSCISFVSARPRRM